MHTYVTLKLTTRFLVYHCSFHTGCSGPYAGTGEISYRNDSSPKRAALTKTFREWVFSNPLPNSSLEHDHFELRGALLPEPARGQGLVRIASWSTSTPQRASLRLAAPRRTAKPTQPTRLQRAFPEGIDVFSEGVGGRVTTAAVHLMDTHGRMLHSAPLLPSIQMARQTCFAGWQASRGRTRRFCHSGRSSPRHGSLILSIMKDAKPRMISAGLFSRAG
ncbi:hypothetical protein P3T23_006075 [Paraburkholderia sp. GAS448]